MPTGTAVQAAADGLILASFNEQRIRYPGNTERSWKGKPIYWGYGLFALVLHNNGWLTVYGHLHQLAASLLEKGAYVEPKKTTTMTY